MAFFGPSFDYKEIDPKNYVGNLADANLNTHAKFGYGQAGKSANKIIGQLDSGEDVSNFLGSELGTIDADAAQNSEKIKNQVMGATAYAGQPVAAAAVNSDAQNDLNQRKMREKAGMVSGLRSTAYRTAQDALNAKNQNAYNFNALREKQLSDAIQGYGSLLKGPTSQGIFGQALGGLLGRGLQAGAGLATGGLSTLAGNVAIGLGGI